MNGKNKKRQVSSANQGAKGLAKRGCQLQRKVENVGREIPKDGTREKRPVVIRQLKMF